MNNICSNSCALVRLGDLGVVSLSYVLKNEWKLDGKQGSSGGLISERGFRASL